MKNIAWIVFMGLLLGWGCSTAPLDYADDEDGPSAAPAPQLPRPEGERAFQELAAYYAAPDKVPAYAAAIRDLTAQEPERRRSAGTYLEALLRQLYADETNGRGVWTSSGYWGGGSESPTRQLRTTIAKALSDTPAGDEALQAVSWLLTKEKAAENQVAGMILLERVPGARSDAMLASLLREPHPNGEILSRAVAETARRRLTALTPELRILAYHHRRVVREAARKAAAELGIADLPAFSPERAFSPAFERRIRSFADLVLPAIPENAPWVHIRVTTPSRRAGDEPRVEEYSGWRLAERDGKLRLLNAYGGEHEAATLSSQVTIRSLREEAQALILLREGADKDERENSGKLSRGGSLSGQFEAKFISAPEALVAAWCLQRNDRETAARLLLSRFDTAKDDRWVSWVVRDLLGHIYHSRMLDEFSYKRNYDQVLPLAAHLSKSCFDEYEYQPRAKELTRQLARRKEDFKTLVLPTAEEWAAIRKPLDRKSQIRYLADRLRLLNCIQWGQPGDVKYSDPQYPKPIAGYLQYENLDPRKLPRVINPYLELRGLKLSIGELPLLVPYLADGDFMPTYSFWRSFHPSRTLHRVSWVVADVVNDAALRDLADRQSYDRLDAAGRKAHRERILAWCREHASIPRCDLLLEVLRTATKWEDLDRQAFEAFESRVPGVVEALTGRLREFPEHLTDFAEISAITHVPGALPLARPWMKESSKELRFFGALILLRGDDADRNAGLAMLDRIFAQEGFDLHAYAVDDLLALQTPEADRLALLACRPVDPFLEGARHQSDVLRRLFLRGLAPSRDYILAQLLSEKKDQFGYTQGDEMASLLYGWAEKIDLEGFDTLPKRESLKLFMTRWVNDQFSKIEKGVKPDMRTEIEPIRRWRWKLDAP